MPQSPIKKTALVLFGLLLVCLSTLPAPRAALADSVQEPSCTPLPGTTFASLAPGSVDPAGTQPSPESFADTNDANSQRCELEAYIAANYLPTRIVQVNLATQPKISQFSDIDSSETGYGHNACGLVAAAAAAMGGKHWDLLVGQIADAAGENYGVHTGIQPSPYVAALQKVFGTRNVVAQNHSSLGTIYEALRAARIVIVDLKVNANFAVPSPHAPSYSHFARVLGIDLNRQQIYIENTLDGDPYWALSFESFLEAWKQPEITASLVPDPQNAEEVTRWLVILNLPIAPCSPEPS